MEQAIGLQLSRQPAQSRRRGGGQYRRAPILDVERTAPYSINLVRPAVIQAHPLAAVAAAAFPAERFMLAEPGIKLVDAVQNPVGVVGQNFGQLVDRAIAREQRSVRYALGVVFFGVALTLRLADQIAMQLENRRERGLLHWTLAGAWWRDRGGPKAPGFKMRRRARKQ